MPSDVTPESIRAAIARCWGSLVPYVHDDACETGASAILDPDCEWCRYMLLERAATALEEAHQKEAIALGFMRAALDQRDVATQALAEARQAREEERQHWINFYCGTCAGRGLPGVERAARRVEWELDSFGWYHYWPGPGDKVNRGCGASEFHERAYQQSLVSARTPGGAQKERPDGER